MSRIFVSYRRSDAGGHAGRIFDRLRDQFGTQHVFFDQDAIEPGDHFPARIDTAIRSAALVLVVIGPDWLESLNSRATSEKIDFVQREVSIAIERKANPDDPVDVIPLLVGDATVPDRDRLHADLRDPIGPLFDYQALALQGPQRDQDHQFEHLLARVANVCGIVPGASMADAGEPPVLSIQAPTTGLLVSGSEQPVTLPPVDIDKLEQTFRPVSRMLLDWPQETEGHWIERPELSQLRDLTTRRSPSVTVLLGGPGEGKSAILARLGSLLVEDHTLLLAIKADRIPRDVVSLRQLDDWIDCGVELTTGLRRLAEQRRVVVLIDQLDALAELMDQHSQRLSALLRLVESVRDTRNLHVVVSCREFEFRHDVRLKTLRAEQVTLERPAWEGVRAVLNACKIDTDRWSEEVRDVLRTPANLAIYLELLARDMPVPDFTNYQALLDRVITERVARVYNDPTVQAAERIAAEMATEEDLSLARARFPDLTTEIANLESAGVLISSSDGLRVAFRHQTLFDVLRARFFLRGASSLADYVMDQTQQSLFVRPTVWSTLNYLRASDTPAFHREFLRLWRNDVLRLHLRYLLIAYLGQVPDPTDEEARWLCSKLAAPDARSRVLSAMASNGAAWFVRLRDRLPQFMTEAPRQAWATAAFLAGSINLHRDAVVALIQQHWIGNPAYIEHALHVLYEARLWNTESMNVAFGCVDRIADQTPGDTFRIWRLMEAIAQSHPDLALKLLAYYLNARTKRIAGVLPDDGNDHDSSSRKVEKYEGLFDDTIWYEIGKLFGGHPREFLEEVWPWFIDVLRGLEEETTPFRNIYRGHRGLTLSGVAEESDVCKKTLEQMMRGLATKYPDAFVDFVIENEDSDLNVVHRLLSLGLEQIAANRPEVVLHYLTDDPRRLGIAEVWYHFDSIRSAALISAVVPELGADDAHRLEEAVIGYDYYLDDPTDSDVKHRSRNKKRSREHRLPLLRAFPTERLSPARQRYLQEEERALPSDPDWESWIADERIEAVQSPMSGAQMTKAGDGDIVRLFEMLPDSTEWRHPTRNLELPRFRGHIESDAEGGGNDAEYTSTVRA